MNLIELNGALRQLRLSGMAGTLETRRVIAETGGRQPMHRWRSLIIAPGHGIRAQPSHWVRPIASAPLTTAHHPFRVAPRCYSDFPPLGPLPIYSVQLL